MQKILNITLSLSLLFMSIHNYIEDKETKKIKSNLEIINKALIKNNILFVVDK